MRALLVLAILGIAAPAIADEPAFQATADQVVDMGGTLGKSEIESALTAAPVAKAVLRCSGAGNLIGWIEFQNGKVVTAAVGGSTDRAFEKCVAAALRTAKLASKARAVATLSLLVPVRPSDKAAATLDAIVSNPAVLARLDLSPPAERDPNDKGPLTQDDINRVIKAGSRDVRTCYSKQLETYPKLAGKIVIAFEIAGTGTVVKATVAPGSTLANDAVRNCIVERIKALKFPATGAPTKVNYPFIFTQG